MPENTHNSPPADARVDASGQQCPVPLLMTRQAAKNLAPGQVLHVISTDQHTGLDLEAWCLRFGHRLIHRQDLGKRQEYWIVIGQTAA